MSSYGEWTLSREFYEHVIIVSNALNERFGVTRFVEYAVALLLFIDRKVVAGVAECRS